jgi:hypothetical protein
LTLCNGMCQFCGHHRKKVKKKNHHCHSQAFSLLPNKRNIPTVATWATLLLLLTLPVIISLKSAT